MNDKSFKIFIDFDGTITKVDVGEELFLRFGNYEQNKVLIDNWNLGGMNAWDGWRALCNSVISADKNEMIEYLDKIEIDPAFKNFISFCEEKSLPVKIISDGFDFYIKTILEKENLSQLEFSSNVLEFTNDAKLIPHFPNAQEDCNCCGNCKRNYVLDNSGDEDFTVFIGDGVSDRCPIQYCDFIFAKNSLLKFCEINRITYFPYNDFGDVQNKLEELISKKRLKKRHQAELKRREVFIQG